MVPQAFRSCDINRKSEIISRHFTKQTRPGEQTLRLETLPRFVCKLLGVLPQGHRVCQSRHVEDIHRGQQPAGVRVPRRKRRPDQELVGRPP
jgi:hypothetical protein